jgi:hypothetical protein
VTWTEESGLPSEEVDAFLDLAMRTLGVQAAS